MRKILSLLTLALCATACIYPYEPDLEEAPEGILAVDGDISLGDVSSVQLSTLTSLWNTANTPERPKLTGAKVWVEDDAGNTYPGNLDLDATFDVYYPSFVVHTENAPEGRRYRLCVDALGAQYASEWSEIAPTPVIRKIEFLCGENDDQVTVAVSVDGGEDGTGYLQLSYDETWEFHADYYPNFIVDTESWSITPGVPKGYSHYWCWRSADNRRIYPVDYTGMAEKGIEAWPITRFPRTDSRNHKRYCIRVKAKTLTKESYRFLKQLEENTDGGDNLFTPNPGEIPGNLHCESDPDREVLGYVTVGRTAWKRSFMDNKFQKVKKPNDRDLYYLVENKDLYKTYYEMAWMPLVENTNEDRDPEMEGPYGWGAGWCYDCIAAGGTQEKPSYWYDE